MSLFAGLKRYCAGGLVILTCAVGHASAEQAPRDAKASGNDNTSVRSYRPATRPSSGASFASATSSANSNGKPVVSTRTQGPGSKAWGAASITRNGQTERVESESRDGLPEKVKRQGKAGGAGPVNAGDARAHLERMIKSSDIPDDLKQMMLQALNQ